MPLDQTATWNNCVVMHISFRRCSSAMEQNVLSSSPTCSMIPPHHVPVTSRHSGDGSWEILKPLAEGNSSELERPTELSPMDERRAMGHHFDSRLAIPVVYSRDFLCQIHTKLLRMFRDIRSGIIDPEESRAQRIAREKRRPNRRQMMLPQAVMWKERIASLSNLCRSLRVSLTFQGRSCQQMISSDADSTKFRVWFTYSVTEVSYLVADHGQETMDPLSLTFRKVAGKPFANSALRRSRSERRASIRYERQKG